MELECTDLAGREHDHEHDPSERQDDHPRGLVHVGSRDRRVAPRFDGQVTLRDIMATKA